MRMRKQIGKQDIGEISRAAATQRDQQPEEEDEFVKNHNAAVETMPTEVQPDHQYRCQKLNESKKYFVLNMGDHFQLAPVKASPIYR